MNVMNFKKLSRLTAVLSILALNIIIYKLLNSDSTLKRSRTFEPVIFKDTSALNKSSAKISLKLTPTTESKYNIIFLETNKQSVSLTPRQLCSIESAVYRNSAASVVLYTLYPKKGNISFLFNHYPNFELKEIEPDELFNNTPLLKWYRQGTVLKSEFSVVHIADAGRLALLLKHGGFYSDLDTITLKSVEHLTRYNGLGYLYELRRDSLCNSHLHFKANHPFMKYIIDRLVEDYNPNRWRSIGPELFVAGLRDFCKMQDIFNGLLLEPLNRTRVPFWSEEIKEANSCNLTIFPERYFYSYSWESAELPKLFLKNATVDVSRLNETFSLHLFGKITSQIKVEPGDKSVYDFLASMNCPKVYEHVKSNQLQF